MAIKLSWIRKEKRRGRKKVYEKYVHIPMQQNILNEINKRIASGEADSRSDFIRQASLNYLLTTEPGKFKTNKSAKFTGTKEIKSSVTKGLINNPKIKKGSEKLLEIIIQECQKKILLENI